VTESFTIRQAAVPDAALIAQQRRLMFTDSATYPDQDLAEMESAYTQWVANKMTASEYLGWFAENDQREVVAGAGLWLREWPPILKDPTGRLGYIENVYTMPDYRRRGLSRRLMTTLLDWARSSRRVYLIELHGTALALPLYRELGFESDEGMMQLWVGPTA
jgi:GNAT superfamily N-acetyltransferase